MFQKLQLRLNYLQVMKVKTNSVLEEKWRTQREMAREADYSIKKLMDNSEKLLKELSEKEGFHFRYGTPSGTPPAA